MEKETIDIFFSLNGLVAFISWVFYTLLRLSMFKDENEKTFNFVAYFWESWDNWLVSLVGIPILLWVGYMQLDLGLISEGLKWNDLFYVGAGVVPDIAVFVIKTIRKKFA